MTLLENLEEAAQDLENHCGVYNIYLLNYPIDINMDMFWRVEDDQITFAEDAYEIEEETENYYVEELKYIFRGDIYSIALICANNRENVINIFNTKNELK